MTGNVIPFPRRSTTSFPGGPLDLNFYPEKEVETLKALPEIVIDCDLTGWSFHDLVYYAREGELLLWDALNDVDADGNVVPKWK
jgi:hypothetical protein